MNARPLLLAAAAAIALAAAPALAQQDHGAHGGAALGAQGIAQGTVQNGVRTVEMAVTDSGFEPSKVLAKKGEKLRLVITRKTDSTCAKEIVVKEHGIHQPLPLGKPVVVELTPKKSGEIRYACGMDHISGVVLVP
jgi:plastocyanin domain-containing protein